MELDWVKIKAGEFRPGFTEAQKQKIRELASAKIDFKSWTKKEYALFEEFLIKYRQYWDKSSPPFPYPDDLDKALRPLKTKEVENLLEVESALARAETTVQATKIEQFYITRYPVTVEQFTPFFKRIKHKLTRKELRTLHFDEALIDEAEQRNKPAGINDSVIAEQFCEAVGGRLPTLFEKDKLPLLPKYLEMIRPLTHSADEGQFLVNFWTIDISSGDLEEWKFTQEGLSFRPQFWLREKHFVEPRFRY